MKRHHLGKYLVIVIPVVLLLIIGLLVIWHWEKIQDIFPEEPSRADEENVVVYNGTAYQKKDHIQSVLLIGLDKTSEDSKTDKSKSVQADFLTLLVFDDETRQTTALQINRDTIANVNRLDITGNKIGTEKKQIALAYNFAYDDSGSVNCRNTTDAVSDLLLNCRIDHYFSFTMDAVPCLNDLVGGVEVTVLDDFTGVDDTLVKGETVTLHGEQALRYVRSRQSMKDSSNTARMARQRQYVNALIDKANACREADEKFALKLWDEFSSYVQYNSTDYRMKEIARKYMEYEFTDILELDGFSNAGEEFMEFHPDEESIRQTVYSLFYQPVSSAE